MIPVIDVKDGQAVHARGGRREQYKPLQLTWANANTPLALARAYRERFGFHHLYLADLDAIAGAAPNLRLVDSLLADGFSLWVDPGLRDQAQLALLLKAGVDQAVVALETLSDPRLMSEYAATAGPDRLVFSIDMNAGRLRTAASAWETHPRFTELVTLIGQAGIESILLLDLAQVGSRAGICSWVFPLLAKGRECAPAARWFAGGGLAHPSELTMLRQAGLAGVLVGSALHDGKFPISPHDQPER